MLGLAQSPAASDHVERGAIAEPSVTVALVGLPPLAVAGIRARLQLAGATCTVHRAVPDLDRSPAGTVPHVALVYAGRPDDTSAAWSRAVGRTVHLVDDLGRGFVPAVQAGATGVASLLGDLDTLVQVVLAAASGHTVVPPEVMSAIRAALPPARPDLPETETAWLQRLADGATMAALARHVGCSEREMHRRLTRVYERLGVATRTEALLVAARSGLLTGQPA